MGRPSLGGQVSILLLCRSQSSVKWKERFPAALQAPWKDAAGSGSHSFSLQTILFIFLKRQHQNGVFLDTGI